MRVQKGSKSAAKTQVRKPNWQQGLTTPNKGPNATRAPKWDKKEIERSGLKSAVQQVGADVEVMRQGGRVQDFMPERQHPVDAKSASK